MASDTAGAVEKFLLAAEGLDEKACQALREADPETQKAVLARGDLYGTRDPSAALIARIRNHGLTSPWGGFGKGGGGGPTVDVEAFLAENDPLDERAQKALRGAATWVQAGVVAGGSVKEAKNPSAALISRLSAVQNGGGGGGWGADPWGMGAWGMGGWGGGKGWGPWDMGWGKGGGKDPWSIGFQMGFGGGGGGGWGGKSWSGGWDHKAEPTSRFLLFDLPEGASEEGIREYFGAFAKIEEVTLKKIESNGKIVGSVKFASPTDELRNQMLKQPHQMLGTTITVQTYKMQKQQKPGYAAKREAETAKYLEEKAASWAAKSKGKGSAYMAY